jgi:HEAT repeat protein
MSGPRTAPIALSSLSTSRAVLALAAVVLASGVFVSSATATPPGRDQVRPLLMSYEQMPPAERWQALGPETLGVLVALYNDPSEPAFVRIRAVHAAGHFAIPATRTFLLAVARAEGQGDLFVREAVMALGRAFGEASVPDVRPFLSHQHTTVREGAVLSLRRVGSARALDALRARRSIERAPHVREAIERALSPAP